MYETSIRNQQYVRYFTDVIQGVFKCVRNKKKKKEKIMHDRNRVIKRFEFYQDFAIKSSNTFMFICFIISIYL